MPLTEDDRTWVRSHIGDAEPPTDGDLDSMYDRLGTARAVVVEVWDKKLADLLNQPAQFDVPGQYSQNVSANIKALQEKLKLGPGFSPGDLEDRPASSTLKAIRSGYAR